jgi:hypothetical protein
MCKISLLHTLMQSVLAYKGSNFLAVSDRNKSPTGGSNILLRCCRLGAPAFRLILGGADGPEFPVHWDVAPNCCDPPKILQIQN